MYNYKGKVVEIIDWDEVLIDVDLGLNCSRLMVFKLRLNMCNLKEYVTIKSNKKRLIQYLTDLLVNREVYFLTHKTSRIHQYSIDLVFVSPEGELLFLDYKIKSDFCG